MSPSGENTFRIACTK